MNSRVVTNTQSSATAVVFYFDPDYDAIKQFMPDQHEATGFFIKHQDFLSAIWEEDYRKARISAAAEASLVERAELWAALAKL